MGYRFRTEDDVVVPPQGAAQAPGSVIAPEGTPPNPPPNIAPQIPPQALGQNLGPMGPPQGGGAVMAPGDLPPPPYDPNRGPAPPGAVADMGPSQQPAGPPTDAPTQAWQQQQTPARHAQDDGPSGPNR